MIKPCSICSTPFDAHFKTLTCSEKCRKARNRQKYHNWNAKYPEKVQAYEKKTRENRASNGKGLEYSRARRSSKAGYLDRFMERIRNAYPETDVTREYLESLFGDSCSVSGVAFNYDRSIGTSFTNPYAPSIDRIDSLLPYQVGNIQIVLSAINFAKNSMSMSDFTKVWKDIVVSWSALTAGNY